MGWNPTRFPNQGNPTRNILNVLKTLKVEKRTLAAAALFSFLSCILMQRPREAPTQQATETHKGRRLPKTQAACKGPHYCHGEASRSGLSMHGNDAAVPSGISGRKIRASSVLPLPGKPLNLKWHFPVHVAGIQSVATVDQYRNRNGSPNMEPNRRSSLCRGLDPPLCSDKSLLDPSASGGYNMDSHVGIKWVDKPKTIYERIGSFMLFNSYIVFPKYACEYHSSTVQKAQYCNIA